MLKSTRYDQPCKICGKTNGNCRSSQDENLILCMTFADRQDQEINGYKWKGYSKDHLWGKWLKVNNDKSHRGVHTPPKVIYNQEGVDRKISPLTDQEKNYQYRKIQEYLGLTNNHRQKLIDRGLPDHIADQFFFTLNHHTKLPLGIDDNFVGVIKNNNGYFLAQKLNGFTCPIFAHNGLIIGYQIRVDDPVNNNKYFWAKGKFSSHNSNGKLPLTFVSDKVLGTVHTPQNSIHNKGGVDTSVSNYLDLNLCEGILKPFVSFLNFGGFWCGGSGGNFDVDQIIEYLDHNPKIDRIILNPDAGAINNKNVLRQYHKVIKELSLRLPDKEILIRWWGQNSKDDQDIDEINLETFYNAKLIDAHKWIKQYYQGLSDHSEENFKKELDYQWKKLKKFTHDEQVSQQYLSKDLLMINYEFYQGIAIKSGLGTGKTTALVEYIKFLGYEQKWISIGYRNSLNKQFCKKANFHFIHDSKFIPRDSNEQLIFNLSLCIHSILRLSVEDFIGKNVILDEVESIINALFFDKNIKLPRKVITHFIKCLKACKNLYLLDGNLTDKSVEYIEKISGKKIKKVRNTYHNKFNYKIFEGTETSEGIQKNNFSDLTNQILENSKLYPIAVCSDSQNELETLERLLKEQNITVIRIDSKTITDKYIDNFLVSFDENEIKKYQVLLYSPTAESGLDIPIRDYFKVHYGLFFGVITHDAILQMMGRIRDNNCDKILWISSRRKFNNDDNEFNQNSINFIQNELEKKLHYILKNDELCLDSEEKINLHKDCYKGYEKDINYQFSLQLQSMINYENKNLRECVIHTLQQIHNVSFITGNNGIDIRQDRQDTKGNNCVDIAVSDTLPDNFDQWKIDRNGLQWKNTNSNSENIDRVSLINLVLRQRLPLIKDSNQWENKTKQTYKVGGTKEEPITLDLTNREYLFYYSMYKNRNIIKDLENKYFYHNFDLIKKIQEAKIARLNNEKLNNDELIVNFWQYSDRFSFISSLKELNLDYFLIGDNSWNKHTEEVKRVSKVIKNDRKLQLLINYKPNINDSDIAVVNTLLTKLNVFCNSKKITLNDERVNNYSKKDDSDIDKFIYQSIEKRLNDLRVEINWEFLSDETTEKTETNNSWVITNQNNDNNDQQLKPKQQSDKGKINLDDLVSIGFTSVEDLFKRVIKDAPLVIKEKIEKAKIYINQDNFVTLDSDQDQALKEKLFSIQCSLSTMIYRLTNGKIDLDFKIA